MSVTEPAAPAGILPDPFARDPAIDPPSGDFDDVQRQIEDRVWLVRGTVTTQQGEVMVEREYIQEPLSYVGMIQFTGLLGRKIDEAMSGANGIGLADIVELGNIAQTAGNGNVSSLLGAGLTQNDFKGIDAFIRGFAKLCGYMPDLLEEAQTIWLRIPFRDRMLVREIWSKPPSKGGLTGAEGEEMLTLFIRQNYEELEAFFGERLRRIGQAMTMERKRIHPDD